MFLDNKYSQWYQKLVEGAVIRGWSKKTAPCYTEKHHIIPRSLGGDNTKDNLVHLTAREHFVAHLLLTKMCDGMQKSKMHFALHMFNITPGHTERYINSNLYEYVRKGYAEAVSRTHLGVPKPQTAEGIRKIKEARAKQVFSKETIDKRNMTIASLIWINNGIKCSRIKPELLDKYTEDGWSIGRLTNYVTEDYKNKLSFSGTQDWQKRKGL